MPFLGELFISEILKKPVLDPKGDELGRVKDLVIVRGILDKQIVDINGAKVVRVNDVKLEGYDTEAILIAVDVGMRGIMRRLGGERGGGCWTRLFKKHIPYNLISWNYLQPL